VTAERSLSLEPEERRRYARQLAIPELGENGQERLKAARVLVVGVGGLGSPASLYLAAAGIGALGIVDPDAVEISNLQRQILYGERDVGRPKVKAARQRLGDLNSHVQIEGHPTRFAGAEARKIAAEYDVIVDGTDNLESRYVMNDVALDLGIPYAYGAVFQLEGQAALLCVPGGPCYRCLFPTPPPTETIRPAAETGILGVVPGIIGLLQATEVVRWISRYAEPAVGRLTLYDARRVEFMSIAVDADPSCPACRR
jgi:molybdopterin/thiamine biosynthesis adenylyltransferase